MKNPDRGSDRGECGRALWGGFRIECPPRMVNESLTAKSGLALRFRRRTSGLVDTRNKTPGSHAFDPGEEVKAARGRVPAYEGSGRPLC
jgi:hypothetical protein